MHLPGGHAGDGQRVRARTPTGSQFFLVYDDSPLPDGYTVFGRMSAAGVKVVKDVAAGGHAAADGTAPKQ